MSAAAKRGPAADLARYGAPRGIGALAPFRRAILFGAGASAVEVEKILTHRLLFTAARVASADGQWEKRLASFVDGINGESTTAVVCPVPF